MAKTYMTYDERHKLPSYNEDLRSAWRALTDQQKENLSAIIMQTADNNERFRELFKGPDGENVA